MVCSNFVTLIYIWSPTRNAETSNFGTAQKIYRADSDDIESINSLSIYNQVVKITHFWDNPTSWRLQPRRKLFEPCWNAGRMEAITFSNAHLPASCPWEFEPACRVVPLPCPTIHSSHTTCSRLAPDFGESHHLLHFRQPTTMARRWI